MNRTYLVDVLEGLGKIENDSIDIILADPPYNIGKNFGTNKTNIPIKDYMVWCNSWINECYRVLKPTGSMFIYGFSETLAHISSSINYEHRWLVWYYTNKTSPRLKFWQRSHESILCVWKDSKSRIFNVDDVRIPYTNNFIKNAAGKIRQASVGRFSKGSKKTIYKAHSKGALPRDVIKISALAGGAGRAERWKYCKSHNEVFFNREHSNCDVIKHPTQKPLALSLRLLKSCKPDFGGVVLIPFSGSGAEALAAKKLNMNFIGFDINSDYVKMANKILEKDLNE